jgi:hypothetical protein
LAEVEAGVVNCTAVGAVASVIAVITTTGVVAVVAVVAEVVVAGAVVAGAAGTVVAREVPEVIVRLHWVWDRVSSVWNHRLYIQINQENVLASSSWRTWRARKAVQVQNHLRKA